MFCLLQAGIGSEEETVHDSASDAFQGGMRFGVYEIDCHADGSLCELGRGAMGVTYRATDTSLQRKVALKIIKTDIAERSADARERFAREARAAAALRHENIAVIHHFGMRLETGQYFYAMELIEGETLDERVHRAGPMDARATIGIAQQVASALAAAEKHGLVHRDLKPANLMLVNADDTEAERSDQAQAKRSRIRALRKSGIPVVKIIDFGLAKAFHSATDPKSLTHDRFVGTPAFASPEQFEHSALDVRSDIYSLGETLWFVLTGKTAFAGRTLSEIQRAQKSNALPLEQLKAAHVPHGLKSLLGSMLAYEPASRPGTAELAARLKRCSPEARGVRRTRAGFVVATSLVLGMSALFFARWLQVEHAPLNLPPPDKSIAVLPFENLSDQKQNAYFTDGVQDEIITDLTKVGDLKVISRTSVMQYKDVRTRNVREIAHQLGVAHVLEGTVQRVGDRVKISAQLIDARADTHLWATTFDRSLADVFAVQSEVAFNIVNQLKAKLSSAEEAAIKQKPTNDLVAYDRFVRAKVLIESIVFSGRVKESLFEAAQLLNEATTRDPTFLRAFCQLARVHDKIYILGLDHTPERVAMGDEAIKKAVAINPEAGEVHLAQANHLYSTHLDYDVARRELAIATRFLPNEPKCFELAGFMARRAGNWEEAVRQLSKALELDPRNVYLLHHLAVTYEHMRRFPEMAAAIDRAIAVVPDDIGTRVARGFVDLEWRADTKLLDVTIEQAIAKDPAITTEIAESWGYLALCKRDWVAAERAIAVHTNACQIENIVFPRGWCEGFVARKRGDSVGAHNAFLAARAESEKIVREQPDFGGAFCALGMIEAALGDKNNAIEHGERAVQLLPIEKDAIDGPLLVQYLSIIYSWTGEKDLAIKQLKRVATTPSAINYGVLRLHPYWDELRGDPRFEQIVASLAPK
jgi:serine/threonine protein kinase/tetratricopeptide (TPR) repeat protein